MLSRPHEPRPSPIEALILATIAVLWAARVLTVALVALALLLAERAHIVRRLVDHWLG